MIDLLGVFESAWGQRPAKHIAVRGGEVSRPDLDLLVKAHENAPRSVLPEGRAHEIWPLVSHHAHRCQSLFAGGAILPRVLALLLTHDGIVAADPLVDVVRLAHLGQSDRAATMLSEVMSSVAAVEPLLAGDVLRVTSLRPKLTDAHRRSVLAEFGLDERMLVFTNFLESAVTVAELPGSFAREYRPQVVELFDRFGLPAPPLPDVVSAADAVRRLAAAVIEVSWQFAVCAQDPGSDLAIRGPVELHLAEQLLGTGLSTTTIENAERMLGKTRHLLRFEVGNLPTLSADRLTVADAIAIRKDDTFAGFRDQLRSALDQLDDGFAAHKPPYLAQAVFEERMRAAAEDLDSRVRRTSFTSRLRDASVPMAIGATSALTFSPLGPAFSAGATVTTALTTVVWSWLTARLKPKGAAAGRRYFSMLGGLS